MWQTGFTLHWNNDYCWEIVIYIIRILWLSAISLTSIYGVRIQIISHMKAVLRMFFSSFIIIVIISFKVYLKDMYLSHEHCFDHGFRGRPKHCCPKRRVYKGLLDKSVFVHPVQILLPIAIYILTASQLNWWYLLPLPPGNTLVIFPF